MIGRTECVERRNFKMLCPYMMTKTSELASTIKLKTTHLTLLPAQAPGGSLGRPADQAPGYPPLLNFYRKNNGLAHSGL